jgi:predicted amidophosphoribosyltransferase
MPVCPSCGSQQPDGAAFCDECGAKLGEVAPAAFPPAAAPAQPAPTTVVTTCPVCGASVMPGEPFCNNCGAALGPAAPLPPPQAAMPIPPPATVLAGAPAAGPVCPSCGAQLEPGSQFCDMCGAPVSAAGPPPPPLAPAPVPPPAPTPTPPPQPSPMAPAPSPAYPPGPAVQGRLVVQGTNATLPFPPGKTEVIVGREDPVSGIFPDIDLTDHGGDEGGVSRRHARIFVQGTQVLIEDLNSTNYTYVSQQKLTPGQPHPLNDGDEVRIGRVKLGFYST